jgi:hypothetical protein
MTDRAPNHPDDAAPETVNQEQIDAPEQAQTVTQQALDRSTSVLGLDEDSEKVTTGDPSDAEQDLVDHMKQMEHSGRLDRSAYAGERNDDDEESPLGRLDPAEDDHDQA